MPIKYLNPADGTEIWVDTGERIGPLEDVISIEDIVDTDIVDTENIQLVNRINEMNAALSDLTATFEFTISNITNALKILVGIEDNNWRRMHGMKPRRRPLKERKRKHKI